MKIDETIRLTRAAYGKLKEIFPMNTPIELKHDLYNQCILKVTSYGPETWVFTKAIIDRLRVNERKILGVNLKTNTFLR